MWNLIINIYLLTGAYQDGTRGKIKNWYLWFGVILNLPCMLNKIYILKEEIIFIHIILNLLPGLTLLFLSKINNENIGNGDGWMLLVIGNYFIKTDIWYIFIFSFFLLSIFSMGLLFVKKVTKTTKIPYIPFLWLSHSFFWGTKYVL